ncbi:hypothetical protein F4802DRAFT_518837 [Xylaria palmicola]|nr:hypothetical protein F4802DRAFT_518837 [Xylaria palmicola]
MDSVDPDTSISNGSCWSNVNVALEDDYIPCGNVASGNSYACCHYGDNCLSSNACYHARFGITYLAGCTSQDFSGPACQNKGDFFDQPWVGLVRCDPDQTSWAGCPEEDNIVGTKPPTANCKCSKDTILFEDSPTLENIASLPHDLGGTISWFPGHEPATSIPTDNPSSTTTRATGSMAPSSPSNSGVPSSSPPAPTSTPSTPSSPPTTSLSVGAKAGIGVGSAIGAIAIGCLIALAVIRRRRRGKKEMPGSPPSLPTAALDPAQRGPSAPGFSVLGGFKAELPADEPWSPATLAPSSMPSSPAPTPSPSQGQYQPYRPGVYGNDRCSTVSQLSGWDQGHSESPVSALSPRIPEEPQSAGMEGERSRVGKPNSIHELQG